MCGNWLTCNNHIIKIRFMSFICQIPSTLKTCDTITIYKSFLQLRETPLEDFNHVSVSSFNKFLIVVWNIQRLWNFKSRIFFFFVAIVLEFWTIEELFGANCRFIDKFCRNQLTCSNHVIWISFMPFICQIPLTLKMCDIIISPFFFSSSFLRETPLESQKVRKSSYSN